MHASNANRQSLLPSEIIIPVKILCIILTHADTRQQRCTSQCAKWKKVSFSFSPGFQPGGCVVRIDFPKRFDGFPLARKETLGTVGRVR